jgi:hypothetical protein
MPTTEVKDSGEAGLTGRCLCGAVRYRLASKPFDAGWCHCRMCQLNSGSPAMAFAKVPSDDFLVESGGEHIRRYKSSEIAERWFCSECGTPLLVRDFDGATHDFNVATLDRPEAHFYYASHIPWAEACDGLPRYPRSRSEGAA